MSRSANQLEWPRNLFTLRYLDVIATQTNKMKKQKSTQIIGIGLIILTASIVQVYACYNLIYSPCADAKDGCNADSTGMGGSASLNGVSATSYPSSYTDGEDAGWTDDSGFTDDPHFWLDPCYTFTSITIYDDPGCKGYVRGHGTSGSVSTSVDQYSNSNEADCGESLEN